MYDNLTSAVINISIASELLRATLSESGPARILDFGCGTGLALEAVRKLGVKGRSIDLVGTDFSLAMRRLAAARGESGNFSRGLAQNANRLVRRRNCRFCIALRRALLRFGAYSSRAPTRCALRCQLLQNRSQSVYSLIGHNAPIWLEHLRAERPKKRGPQHQHLAGVQKGEQLVLIAPPFRQSPDAEFVPLLYDSAGEVAQIKVRFLPRTDLFASTASFLANSEAWQSANVRVLGEIERPLAVFQFSRGLAVTINRHGAPPWAIQCFVTLLRDLCLHRVDGPLSPALSPFPIDDQAELIVWSKRQDIDLQALESFWRTIERGGRTTELEILTTPKLYGNKQRITDFLFGVAAATLPPGIPILDLMSGTGIVTRKLSARHPMCANDANAYAALLTRSQGVSVESRTVEELLQCITPHFEENMSGLRRLITGALDTESAFPSCRVRLSTDGAIHRVLRATGSTFEHGSLLEPPHRLCTARYANAYFGVNQAAELDSLRSAIDLAIPQDAPLRDLCLSALLLAACTATSGPHFAQPPKITSVRSLRQIAERRARSISWEFELALRRLASTRAASSPS